MALPGPLGNAGWQIILGGAQVAESIVNGQWVEVLRFFFPAPGFIICPEGRDAGNGRTDMVVLQVRQLAGGPLQNRRILAFEGKKGAVNPPATEHAFFNNIDQLAGYMKGAAWLGQYQYGFLALGAQAVLVARQKAASPKTIEEVRFPIGGTLKYGQANNSLTVAGGIDVVELGQLLQAVSNAAINPNNQIDGWRNDFT
ncbi:hypothetical protein MMC14_010608 [Varicellaria rhodocarpa]|nr:hypothetical protein [Varicellaria rhodocarpa]